MRLLATRAGAILNGANVVRLAVSLTQQYLNHIHRFSTTSECLPITEVSEAAVLQYWHDYSEEHKLSRGCQI